MGAALSLISASWRSQRVRFVFFLLLAGSSRVGSPPARLRQPRPLTRPYIPLE